MGAEHIIQKSHNKGIPIPKSIPIALLLTEWLFVSPAITPIPTATVTIPEVYVNIATEDGEFAVFDFPSLHPNSQLAPEVYLFYQSIHNKPIPYSIQESWLHSNPFWRQLMLWQQHPPKGTIEEELKNCVGKNCIQVETIKSDLTQKGFQYFIVHLELLHPQMKNEYQSFWRRLLGEPIVASESTEVFLLSLTSKE